MADHPSTFNADAAGGSTIEWDDRAEIHRNGDGQGLLDGSKALHRGSLAEMVALVAAMPEGRRGQMVIQKLGDHKLDMAEIMALADRADFPAAR